MRSPTFAITSEIIAPLIELLHVLRAMQNIGFMHGDIGNQNILLPKNPDESWAAPSFIDLNRYQFFAKGITHKARGDQVACFFCGPGAEDLDKNDVLLKTVAEVEEWDPIAVITPNNTVPHFFPGVKVQTFHGFDAGKPRHIYPWFL